MLSLNCCHNYVFNSSLKMSLSLAETFFIYFRGALTFPLVVRKELEVGVVARAWLARRQTVPVVLAGVGVLITVARTRVLEERRARWCEQVSGGSEGGERSRWADDESDQMTGLTATYTAYGDCLTLLHDVTRMIVLSENTDEKHQTCWKKCSCPPTVPISTTI